MRARSGLVAALAVLTGALAVAPRPFSSPIARLANYRADSADPIYDAPLNGSALRRAAAILPDHATYTVWTDRSNALQATNLDAATHLLFTPALPLADARAAHWILSYGASTPLPPHRHAVRTYRLAPGIALVEVAP